MLHIKSDTFSDVYRQLLLNLHTNPEHISSPRGIGCSENLGVCLEVTNPEYNLYINNRRSSVRKYIAAELLWYFGGTNKTSDISDFASFWKTIENKDLTVNSAYGHLLFTERNVFGKTEWIHAVETLLSDNDSRQATIRFNKPHHSFKGNKDFPCTMYGIFFIRDNKLDMHIHMRSNDVILGLPTDFAFFSVLQKQMLSILQSSMKDLTLGKYQHIVDSMHLYHRDNDTVDEMLLTEFIPDRMVHSDQSVDFVDNFGKMKQEFETMNRQFLQKQTITSTDSNEYLQWISDNVK